MSDDVSCLMSHVYLWCLMSHDVSCLILHLIVFEFDDVHQSGRCYRQSLPGVYLSMGWLHGVGSVKLYVSFAKEPYERDDILQKRPIILRSLLIVASPYQTVCVWTHTYTHTHTHTYTHQIACSLWTRPCRPAATPTPQQSPANRVCRFLLYTCIYIYMCVYMYIIYINVCVYTYYARESPGCDTNAAAVPCK